MANLEKDIAAYLASQGVGTVGTDIFYSRIKEGAESAGIYVVQFEAGESTIFSGTYRPIMNVYVKQQTDTVIKTKVALVKAAMQNAIDLHDAFVGETTKIYHSKLIGSPLFAGFDEAGLRVFILQFMLIVKDI